MVFLKLATDEGSTVEIGAYDSAAVNKIVKAVDHKKQFGDKNKNLGYLSGAVVGLKSLKVHKKGSQNHTDADINLTFMQSSVIRMIKEPITESTSVASFGEIKDGAVNLSGSFHVVEFGVADTVQGRNGILFVAGDSEKNRAEVFVFTENASLASKATVGKQFEFKGASAKFNGDDLWLYLDQTEDMKRAGSMIENVVSSEYKSPRKAQKEVPTTTTESNDINCWD